MRSDRGRLVSKMHEADYLHTTNHSEAARRSTKLLLLEHLKQVLWALLQVYIILLGLAFLFGRLLGYEAALWVCLSVAGLTTVTFFSIYLCDFLRILITEQMQIRRHKRNGFAQ